MIGTTAEKGIDPGPGKTIPGPCTPFGLVQLSPDTFTGADISTGYCHSHKTIEGFSFLHMSGVGWFGDFGNFLVTPTNGPLKTSVGSVARPDEGYRSRFRHETETASAGYYAVTLDDYNTRVELTAAPRAGMMRFTFPDNKQSRIQIDLARRIGGTSTLQSVKVTDDHTIEGWMQCTPDGGGWGNGQGRANYTVYFCAKFDRPLENYGIWSAAIPDNAIRKRDEATSDAYRAIVARAKVTPGLREAEGKHLGFYTEFPTRAGDQAQLKVGISFTSIAGARANLAADIPDWDFDAVHARARALWRDTLSCYQIEGATDAQREVAATALYHMFIDPRAVTDADGSYVDPGSTPQRILPRNPAYTQRTIFSGWDVFRSNMPLFNLIRPDVVNDVINSLIKIADNNNDGYLARWEFMGRESGCMLGDPAISVATSAWLKGIRGFDAQRAYALCREASLGPLPGHEASFNDRGGRIYYDFYNKNGYVPDSVSWTLENAYFDYCISRFAESLGKTDDIALFAKRAQNYRNIYDRDVGNMRARHEDGTWMDWRGATKMGQGCKESNPYQQGWFVPQDVPGMVRLMGGRDRFLQYLTTFFDKTPADFRWNDYYNHSNEPVHHVAYLFAHPGVGAPWLTQKWTRRIMDNAYVPGVDGLCGNEDVGQMSAWYLMSALGFHPVSPVDDIYIIGSPLFPKVTIKLPAPMPDATGARPEKTFTIIANNNTAENVYIQSAKLNGRPLNRSWLTHEEVASGGVLEFEMGPEPNKLWGLEGVVIDPYTDPNPQGQKADQTSAAPKGKGGKAGKGKKAK